MLEKPDLDEERLIAHLRSAFGLPVMTAVHRAATHDDTAFCVRQRAGSFDELAMLLFYLHIIRRSEFIDDLSVENPSQVPWASRPTHQRHRGLKQVVSINPQKRR